MMRRPLAIALALPLALGACQTAPEADPQIAAADPAPAPRSASAPTAPSPPAFVEAACGGCHAVEPPFLSPNPAAPPFAAIANRGGLSHKSIKPWLMDAHNYPEEMDFDLEPSQVDLIARYLLTLQRGDYVPAP